MKLKLTSMQRTAFAAPCFYAAETANPTFSRKLELEGRVVQVRLTANIGEE